MVLGNLSNIECTVYLLHLPRNRGSPKHDLILSRSGYPKNACGLI